MQQKKIITLRMSKRSSLQSVPKLGGQNETLKMFTIEELWLFVTRKLNMKLKLS